MTTARSADEWLRRIALLEAEVRPRDLGSRSFAPHLLNVTPSHLRTVLRMVWESGGLAQARARPGSDAAALRDGLRAELGLEEGDFVPPIRPDLLALLGGVDDADDAHTTDTRGKEHDTTSP